MKNSPFKQPKQVLVFNGAQVLIAVVRSLHATAEFSYGNLQAISFSCTGRYISTGGFYFRHQHPDMQLDQNNLPPIKLQDYDRMYGYERKYHTVQKMSRKKNAAKSRRKSSNNKKKGGSQ